MYDGLKAITQLPLDPPSPYILVKEEEWRESTFHEE